MIILRLRSSRREIGSAVCMRLVATLPNSRATGRISQAGLQSRPMLRLYRPHASNSICPFFWPNFRTMACAGWQWLATFPHWQTFFRLLLFPLWSHISHRKPASTRPSPPSSPLSCPSTLGNFLFTVCIFLRLPLPPRSLNSSTAFGFFLFTTLVGFITTDSLLLP